MLLVLEMTALLLRSEYTSVFTPITAPFSTIKVIYFVLLLQIERFFPSLFIEKC